MAVKCFATMTQANIAERFNVKRPDIPDIDYGCPSKEWVLGALAERAYKLYCFMGVTKWKGNFDCDNFATGFLFAAACEWGQRAQDRPQGIAVGEVSYCINGNRHKGHRINVAFVGPKREMIFIEPQHVLMPASTTVQVELSKKERRTIRRIKFT